MKTMGRLMSNMSNNLDPEAFKILKQAAGYAAFRFRNHDVGDYISEGWLRFIRKVRASKLHLSEHLPEIEMFFIGNIYYTDKQLFRYCLQEMRRYKNWYWNRCRYETPMSNSLEGLQIGIEEEPLTSMMAEEYMDMLDPVERYLVWMRLWRGLKWSSIGEYFGISKQAAKMRYNVIIRKLQRKAKYYDA
jgi:hypothetical protein